MMGRISDGCILVKIAEKMDAKEIENKQISEWKNSFERVIDYLNEIKSIDEEPNKNGS